MLRPVVLIDSGATRTAVASSRKLQLLSFAGKRPGDERRSGGGGGGHFGARKHRCQILDNLLPRDVELISAKVGDRTRKVTALSVAVAFADTVSRFNPAVVNMSLAPLDDRYCCPNCDYAVTVPALHSTLFRRVIRMTDGTTFTVMAAGNTGQANNMRHLSDSSSSMVLVAALDSNNRRASYSNLPYELEDNLVFAFGGDGPGGSEPGLFQEDEDAFGTSFAAPFISAMAYRSILEQKLGVPNSPATIPKVLGSPMHQENLGWVPNFVRGVTP